MISQIILAPEEYLQEERYRAGKKENTCQLVAPQEVVSNQNGFTKRKWCLTNPTALYEEETDVENKEGCLDVVYLAFSKVFDTISHSLLTIKSAEVWAG